jgi:putative ABC transport system permease protein
MIIHSFKLIWNQKKKNAYIILELFILFIVLLVSSVYLIDKYNLYSGGVGANIEGTYYMRLTKKDYKEGNFQQLFRNLKKDLEDLPDVRYVSYSYSSIPYTWFMSMSGMKYDSNNVSTVIREVDEDFINVFEINLMAGNWFEDDYEGSHKPIIIDIQAAEELFGNAENSLQKIVDIDGDYEIIGVYEMLKRNEYEENYASCFMPIDLTSQYRADIVIKFAKGVSVNPSQLSKIVYSYFNEDEFAIRVATPMETIKNEILASTNIEIVMVSVFAIFLVINIILGMIGIFGYSVKRRKAEMGIRRAFGSSASKIYTLLLFESWSLTIFALVPAILIMIQIPILDLYEVETRLFLSALGLSIVLIFVLVSFSVYYPALLASKTEPAQALQEE